MKCSRKGCSNEATGVPKVNVPATNHPIDTHQPISVIVALPVCPAHLPSPHELLTELLRSSIRAIARDKARPDFARAWVTALGIDSEEYRRFQGMRAARSH